MNKVFIGVKDNIVVNTIIIDDKDLRLIAKIKEEFAFDYLVECNDNQVMPGWLFDGTHAIPNDNPATEQEIKYG